MPPAKPEDRYAAIVKALGTQPRVKQAVSSEGRGGFGSTGQLKVNNRIFAMLVRGELVVKLSKDRVDDLVESGKARRFDPRRNGRLMKEWAVIPATPAAQWLPLAREALSFVAKTSNARA